MNLLTAIENWVDARAAKQVELRLADICRQATNSVMIETEEKLEDLRNKIRTCSDLESRVDDLDCKAEDLERGIDDLESQIDSECVHYSTLDERLDDHEVDYDVIQDRIETKIRHILAEATINIDL